MPNQPTIRRSGFTLVELAIVLSVVGVLTAGLWNIMTNSSQQTKDQLTAQQQQTVINALSSFLADSTANGGQKWMSANVNGGATPPVYPLKDAITGVLPNCATTTDLYMQTFCKYLPLNWNNPANPYGQTLANIQVRREDGAAGTIPQTYSFMIATTGGTAIPDANGGRISGLIGNDGGFVYSNTLTCGATAPTACGTMGGWSINTSTLYGFNGTAPNPAALTAGHLATRTTVTPGTSANYYWLARQQIPGDGTFTNNTMSGGASIYMAANADNIYMMPFANIGAAAPGNTNAMFLGNGSIQGLGATGAAAQINLAQPAASLTNLINLSTGCTATAGYAGYLAGCPAALQITGDIGQTGSITVTYTVTAGKLYSSSDARLKTNIKKIDGALDQLMKINPVSFDFRSDKSSSMGVTAQDLEKVYPQLVTERNGTKYVEYTGLIGPLISAVQDLKRENDRLRDQLNAQKAREDRLEQRANKSTNNP